MFRLFSPQSTGSTRQQTLVRGILVLGGAIFLLWLAVWLLPSGEPPPVNSDEAGTVAAQPGGAGPAFELFTPGRVVVVLLLIGGLGYAVYVQKRSDTSTPQTVPMRVLGRLSITQDQQLQLVSCQDEVLLLGVSPGEIALLRAYPRAAFAERTNARDEFEALPDESPIAGDGTAFSRFADVLRQYTHNGRHA